MKGGGSINTAEELKKSWDNKAVISWTVNDGVGKMTNIFRENAATGNIMPYEEFKKNNLLFATSNKGTKRRRY